MIRAAFVAAVFLPASVMAETVPEPQGYRTEQYRSPVPATLQDATVVDADAAYALWRTGQVAFVDVLPRAPKPDDLPEGTVWQEKPHISIPGATWLPNVGYGQLAEVTQAYFKSGLEKATGADPQYPVVIFCRSDCWMSWNAAKRALELGYQRVFWFPGGTDDWEQLHYPGAEVIPQDGY